MANKSRRQVLIFSITAVATKSVYGQITGQGENIKQIGGEMGLPTTLRPPRQVAIEKHEQNLEDLEKLEKMVQKLRVDLEKSGASTLSASAVRNADQIQKLAKKVHDRLRR